MFNKLQIQIQNYEPNMYDFFGLHLNKRNTILDISSKTLKMYMYIY